MSFDGAHGEVSFTLDRRRIAFLAAGAVAVVIALVLLFVWVRQPEKIDGTPETWGP